jgi:hypothetical protein
MAFPYLWLYKMSYLLLCKIQQASSMFLSAIFIYKYIT